VADLLEEVGLAAREVPAVEFTTPDPGAVAALCLAGGEEAAAADLLTGSPRANVPRLVIGAALDHRLAAATVGRGADDYLALPGDLDLLRRTLDRLARTAQAQAQAASFADTESARHGFETMVGQSAALRQVIDQARRVAANGEVNVLIGGETGTGKELLARAIHYHGPRRRQPFLEINCAAIPASLLESELFGHERGAFTGAVQAKPGLFELADGGTVLLDEIGNLPIDLQAKLLRVLESRELRRVGGQRTRQIDVRIIAATHVDLAAAVRNGAFREDLLFRLHVVALTLPPLRQRTGDAELLAESFAERLAGSYRLPVPPLSIEVRAVLRAHSWPGNIRELRNAIERALILSPPGSLLPDTLVAPLSAPPVTTTGGIPFPATLGTVIRAAAHEMLRQTDGNKSEAARRLGISRPRLQRLLDGSLESPGSFGDLL